MSNYPKPSWKPTIAPPVNWIIERLQVHLHGKRFVVFSNGTCVIWQGTGEPNKKESEEILLSVVNNNPDFKVRRHPDGDFLVTFRGGVGGVVSNEFLEKNMPELRADAYNKGKIQSEFFQTENNENYDDIELIAGLYVRARLYQDVESMNITAIN